MGHKATYAQVARFLSELAEEDVDDVLEGDRNYSFIEACAAPTGTRIGCVLCGYRGYRHGRQWSRLCPVRGCRGLLGYLTHAPAQQYVQPDTSGLACAQAVIERLLEQTQSGTSRVRFRQRRTRGRVKHP